ncbi:MAG: hypothetical protein L3J28_08175 [Candidatus Polarisedimenticolaceae bacterium]|nr:hypothetical protein [Candidatus Polarisedimenticolaceae bacterium]
MRNSVHIALLAALLVSLSVSPVYAGNAPPDTAWLLANPEKIPDLLHSGELAFEELPNPHWREDSCTACHQEMMGVGQAATPLRNENVSKMCTNCHDSTMVAEYIHAVDMVPSEGFLGRMPADFKKSIEQGDGVVTCVACHDLPIQCLARGGIDARKSNPLFFRGGPYDTRTDLCFNCHDPKDYQRKNPHDQITDEGDLNAETCFYCHETTPNRTSSRDIYDVKFNINESLEKLCTGCHPYMPHPGGAWFSSRGNNAGGGANHLRVPPDKFLQQIIKTRKEQDIVLPLEPETGRIFCATCHNPHERGVQFLSRADKGADGYKRLRRGRFNVCSSCHDI